MADELEPLSEAQGPAPEVYLDENVQRAIDALPPDYRLVLLLIDLEGFTYQETADVLEIPVGTVMSRLYRARRQLEKELDKLLPQAVKANAGKGGRAVTAEAAVAAASQLTPDLITHLKGNSRDLSSLTSRVFEELVAEFMMQRGFSDVALVGTNPKTSADIYAVYHITPIDDKAPFFVEVKRWRETVGINVVNAVYGAMLAERPAWGWRAALIVSLAGFSEFRRTTTLELGRLSVLLKDKNDLLRWLSDYQPHPNGLWLPSQSRSDASPSLQRTPPGRCR